MELTAVDVRRARSSQHVLTDETAADAMRRLRAGESISPDDVRFDNRPNAQTEAWRWRHELARRGELRADDIRSATFSQDGGETYRFALYLDSGGPITARRQTDE